MKAEDLKIGDTIFSVDKGRVHVYFITNLEQEPSASNRMYNVPEITINPKSSRWFFDKESYVSSNQTSWTPHTIESCSYIDDLMPQGKRTTLMTILGGNKF